MTATEDETRQEAEVENALHDRYALTRRIAAAVEDGRPAEQRLSAAAAKIRLAANNAEAGHAMADLYRLSRDGS